MDMQFFSEAMAFCRLFPTYKLSEYNLLPFATVWKVFYLDRIEHETNLNEHAMIELENKAT